MLGNLHRNTWESLFITCYEVAAVMTSQHNLIIHSERSQIQMAGSYQFFEITGASVRCE